MPHVVGGDGDPGAGSDSDSTHESMPELTPYPPPVQEPGDAGTSDGQNTLQQHPLQQQGWKPATSRPGRQNRLAVSTMSRTTSSGKGATLRSDPGVKNILGADAWAPPQPSTSSSSDFAKRADALAAVLDQQQTMKVAATSDSTGKVELAHAPRDLDDHEDGIEVSTEAELRARQSVKLDEELAGMHEDSDSEDNPDEDDDEDVDAVGNSGGDSASGHGHPSSQNTETRRKSASTETSLPPPGAPPVAPASPLVKAAVDAADKADAKGCSALITRRSESRRCGGGEGDVSFGPRFQGLNPAELNDVRSRWSLHSLADVKITSKEGNQQVAADFFRELRERRERCERSAAMATASDERTRASWSSGGDGRSDTLTPAYKPTFRHPTSQGSERACKRSSGSGCGVAPGGLVMEECVAGVKRRSAAVNSGGKASSCSASKKARRTVCLAIQDPAGDSEDTE